MNKTLIIILLFLMNIGCSKEKKDFNFEIKEFVPETNYEANRLVQTFINKLPNKSISYKTNTTAGNIEPNEGAWILEGSQNFERRDKHFYSSDEMIKTTLEVNNIIENGEIKMQGEDMILKYLDINSNLQTKEQELGKSAKIVDLQIVSISSTSTQLEVRVIYGNLGSGASSATWPTSNKSIAQATVILNNAINIELSNTVPNPSAPINPTVGPLVAWYTDWHWYAGINATTHIPIGTSGAFQLIYDAANVNSFCSNCLYSGPSGSYFPMNLYQQYFLSIQDAAKDILLIDGITGDLASLNIVGPLVTSGPTESQVFTNIVSANTFVYEDTSLN